MTSLYIAPFVVAALICGGLTYYVKNLAQKFNLADFPSPRKIHLKPIPRLGGIAIVITFLFLTIGYSLITSHLKFSPYHVWFFDKRLLGALFGALVLFIIGILDDIKGLSPWQKLLAHFFAAMIVVSYGLSISYIRLPGNHVLQLDSVIKYFSIFGHGFKIIVWGDMVTVFWIVLLINTLNFLDGLDGLAGGISVIAGISIFFLSFNLGQSAAALLSLIFAGSVFGFLPWNFNPAKIFMGDVGSMFLGYMLAILSIISGGKLATAFLILGLPVLDVIWVILRRIFSHKSPFAADKLHLHHRLLALGLSQRQTVIVLYLVAAAFGIIAVEAGTQEKIQAFYWLLALMSALVLGLIVLEYKRRKKKE